MLTPLPTCYLPIATPRTLHGATINGIGESGGEIHIGHTKERIFKTEAGKVIDGRDIAYTMAIHPASASGDVDL